jgi:hypothetical protein
MPKVSLADFIEQQTLVFSDVPDLHGNRHEWTVPPFDEQTELFFWEWHKQMLAEREREQRCGMGLDEEGTQAEADVRTVGRRWAPFIAACVKEPKLDAEFLAENFHGKTLALVGGEITNFFLTGKTAAEAGEQTTTKKRPKS